MMKIDTDGRVSAAVDMEPARPIGQVTRDGEEWLATLAIADVMGRTGRSMRHKSRMAAATWLAGEYRAAYRGARMARFMDMLHSGPIQGD